MTTVLPAPGHLERHAWQAGVKVVVCLADCVLYPSIAVLFCHLGNVDGGLKGLVLAEEQSLLPTGISPICNQSCSSRRYTDLTALAPDYDAAADVVDELVLFDAVLCPFRLEYGLFCRAVFLFGTRNRHEIGADAATYNLLIRDSFVVKPEMSVGSSNGELMIGFSMTT